jgi:serine/threonine-protein kinase SRPK3
LPLIVVNERKNNWENVISIPGISLAELEKNLFGSNKELFLQFMRKILQWIPEARQSVKNFFDNS